MNEVTLERQIGDAAMRLIDEGLFVLKDDDIAKYEQVKLGIRAGKAAVRITITVAGDFHVMGAVVQNEQADDIFELRASKADAFGPRLTTPAPEAKS